MDKLDDWKMRLGVCFKERENYVFTFKLKYS